MKIDRAGVVATWFSTVTEGRVAPWVAPKSK